MRKKSMNKWKRVFRNIKSRDELGENSRDIRENSGNA